jgi:hypothetical protein
MEIGKKYQLINNRYLGDLSGKKIVVTRITSRTVWFKFEDDRSTYLPTKRFLKYAEEISPWSGNKLAFNFLV